MSRGAGVIRNLSKALASRTLQVTVVPTPIKFQERRAVLHALQKFAKVEVFRKLEDHGSSFVLVTPEEQLAKVLVRQSPLEYQLVVQQPHDVRGFLTTTPSTDPIIQKSETGEGREGQQPETRTEDGVTKHFTLHIFPMPEYVHASAIRASPLHGPWPEPRPKTPMRAILRESFSAHDVSAEALSDWESGGQSADATNSRLVEDLLFGHKSMDPAKRAVAERLRRKEQQRSLPAVVDGLLHLQGSRESNSISGRDQSQKARPGT